MRLIGGLVFSTIAFQLSMGFYEIISYSGNTKLGWYLVIGGIFIWILSLFLSYRYSFNKDLIPTTQKSKNPYVIILLTLFLPGLGQLYNRRIIRGILVILLYYFGFYVTGKGIFPWFSDPLFKAIVSYFGCIDLIRNDDKNRKNVFYAIVLLYITNIIKYGFIIYFYAHFVEIGNTVGYSCEPTLKNGDKTLIDRSARTSLRRGDLVVFQKTEHGLTEKIGKRLIAFEGETVEISHGHVKVNGKPLLDNPFLSISYSADTLVDYGREGRVYTVPKGCIYVLGDNPKESEDSRYYGGVDLEFVEGVNYKIILPIKRISSLRDRP
jgi:signal peptidase I